MGLFNSKKEFITALLSGRKFRTQDEPEYIIRFDETEDNPFRYGDSPVNDIIWNLYNSNTLVEIKEWLEDIPQQGILCLVTNRLPSEKTFKLVPRNILMFRAAGQYFEDDEGNFWQHANPVKCDHTTIYKGE